METKLDIMMRNAKERKEREQNVEYLNSLLNEARELLAAIPNDHQLQTGKERAIVQKRITTLSDLLADENNAIKALSESDAAANLERVFKEMGSI